MVVLGLRRQHGVDQALGVFLHTLAVGPAGRFVQGVDIAVGFLLDLLQLALELGIDHEQVPCRSRQRLPRDIVGSGPESTGHEHDLRAAAESLDGVGDAELLVGHRFRGRDHEAQVGQPLGEERGVGVGHPSGEQFVTDGQDPGAGEFHALNLMFRISPSFRVFSPGMPWQTTWLTEVQMDLGKPL